MALTREERQAIEALIKKVRALEITVETLKNSVDILQKTVSVIGSANDMNDWSSEQWDKFLQPYVLKYARAAQLMQHNHTNNQQGGDCFAKLGANLIE